MAAEMTEKDQYSWGYSGHCACEARRMSMTKENRSSVHLFSWTKLSIGTDCGSSQDEVDNQAYLPMALLPERD
jgi:hypothetical protein